MSADLATAHTPLAVTVRSGHAESVHHGSLVLLESDGSVGFSLGTPDLDIYPRSSMKPLQAVAMTRLGLDLPPDLLALACASHDGRPEHIAGARDILARAGLDESALANTPDLPLDKSTAEALLRAGGERSAVQMNCSGKHAAMLLTCTVNGWASDASYLDPEHPLQRAITDEVTELTGAAPTHIGVDGCGAPAHVVTLIGLAQAFATIARGGEPAHAAIATAMSSHPEMVGGPTRDVTRWMQRVPGLVMKDGAEGVMAAALPDGRALALKVADGADRARPPIVTAAMMLLGVDVTGVDPAALRTPILGHGREVGEVRLIRELAARLGA